MTSKVLFGPSGKPVNYKGPVYKATKYIKDEGLDSFEYGAVRGVRISEKSANVLKEGSKENNILVSMHGPYYINLCSVTEKTVNSSIEHLFKSAKAGEWMGAYRLVFHPGYYSKRDPEVAMSEAKKTIDRLLERCEEEGIENYTFSPETTGKRTQLGNVNEIVELCSEYDHFEPTIDFAHVHARGRGYLNTKDDYNCIFSAIEDNLDIDRLHFHFTTIEYGDGGEIKHHTLEEGDEYGPELRDLLEILIENDWKANIICETPKRDEDAIVMKNIYQSMI